ncbi:MULTISPECIES: YceI family protein [unclassified Frankia]|uniref:YceI family protein n=1 Tax=unclassified Frankia TaxID=2632575 RepID=UPI002AD434BC|nr:MULTISPECIES: YceI family protein [unclassified Frankia]
MTTGATHETSQGSPPGKKPRRWLKGAIIGGIVVIALLVGGPFVYINFIEGDPPAALSVNSQSTQAAADTAGTATVPTDGTWKVGSGSQVGYRVKEVLFGQSTTAVGRTSGVTGQLAISGTTVQSASFTADMTTVASDQSQRDGQFRGRIMETSRYPTVTFTLTKPIDLGSVPATGVTKTYQATGDLTLHGVTKSVSISLETQRSGAQIKIGGQIPIVFADYNVSNPSFPGVVTTEDKGIMEVLLVLTKS